MQNLTVGQIERAIEKSKPEERRQLLSRLAQRYQKDIQSGFDEDDLEKLGWMMLAQSSLGFWDNPKEAIYDRV